jgi:flagellin-like protein
MRGEKKAVSPVVATLILILIAVAAAAALYLWLVNWQGSLTAGIGNPHAQATLTIGGSTSVYPFDELAVTQFQQNQTDVVISNNQGGSGAGMIAVCSGAVDIGAASFPVDVPTLLSTYGCPASVQGTAVITTVAYDAVDVIVSTSNTHGLLSINYDTYALIWQDASYAASGHPTLITHTEDNGSAINASIPQSGAIHWNQIPAAVGGASLSLFVGAVPHPTTEAADAHGVNTTGGVACGISTTVQQDICENAATGTPCGFTVCASGAQAIVTVARSDASGTTQSFEARLIDATNSHAFGSAAQLQAGASGFNGCGGTNYISDCGYVASGTGNGNPGVISATSTNPDAIAYASDGLARASGSGVSIVAYLGVGQNVNAYSSTQPAWYGGILPTTGGSGTIALGIKSSVAGAPAADYTTGYLGWRPFDLVTLNAPTGVAASFISFTLDPANNIALAAEAQEVSVYSV